MMKIAVFASHNGSDLQAIINASKTADLNAEVCAVISNNSDAKALERARAAGISAYHVSGKSYGDEGAANQMILSLLDAHQADIIFLAGYLKRLDPQIARKYYNRIFNIHPALLPRHGGKGMFGIHVHQAVIQAGEKESGITVHRVNGEYDEGEIVAQTKIAVLDSDTAESLAARILEYEHIFIVEALGDIVSGIIPLGVGK